MSECLVSVACFLRALPLFFRSAPRTPLRILCIIALDTLHVLRYSRPLPGKIIRDLAMLVDFQACTNARWDRKSFCSAQYEPMRHELENAGLGSFIEAYLAQLRDLETRRPSISGDQRRFDEVRAYREAVVQLSLTTLTTVALKDECFDDELFRIAMQCQIIDDVLDHREDLSSGLPSFLTACASLPQALELTAAAASAYGAGHESSSRDGVFPLRLALRACTTLAKLFVRVAHWRHNHRPVLAIGLKTDESMKAVRVKR